MKTVFLTGATGNMGREAMKELLSRSDRFQIKNISTPSRKEQTFSTRMGAETQCNHRLWRPYQLRRCA